MARARVGWARAGGENLGRGHNISSVRFCLLFFSSRKNAFTELRPWHFAWGCAFLRFLVALRLWGSRVFRICRLATSCEWRFPRHFPDGCGPWRWVSIWKASLRSTGCCCLCGIIEGVAGFHRLLVSVVLEVMVPQALPSWGVALGHCFGPPLLPLRFVRPRSAIVGSPGRRS